MTSAYNIWRLTAGRLTSDGQELLLLIRFLEWRKLKEYILRHLDWHPRRSSLGGMLGDRS